MSEFGTMVRELRREIGMDQVVLAAALGITASHLSGIETGRAQTTLPTVRAIANNVARRPGSRFDLISAWSRQTPRYRVEVTDPERRQVVAHLAVEIEDLTAADIAELWSVVERRAA